MSTRSDVEKYFRACLYGTLCRRSFLLERAHWTIINCTCFIVWKSAPQSYGWLDVGPHLQRQSLDLHTPSNEKDVNSLQHQLIANFISFYLRCQVTFLNRVRSLKERAPGKATLCLTSPYTPWHNMHVPCYQQSTSRKLSSASSTLLPGVCTDRVYTLIFSLILPISSLCC